MPLLRSFITATIVSWIFLALPMATLTQAGTLQFYANGEDLATEGFNAQKLTKDGWSLTFSHIFVTLTDITAYQTDPPFDARTANTMTPKSQAVLGGVYTVDLVKDADEHSRILVGEVSGADPGHFNAISWKMTPATEGVAKGYSMVLIGTAEKDEKIINFHLYSDEQSSYRCGEFVGDERKGFLQQGGSTDLEMTFHLDHIFGRLDKSAANDMNTGARGFAPFADGNRKHIFSLRGLHIGHAGEGHCSVEWH